MKSEVRTSAHRASRWNHLRSGRCARSI